MRTISRTMLFTLGMFASVGAANAQASTTATAQPTTPQVKEAKPGLLKQATITPDAATHTAMQRVPKGEIREAEIEQEHGKLVYSYDIKVPGKSGIDEVLVDAKTGAVVSHTHESAAAEAAEARQDARAAQKAKAVRRSTSGPRSDTRR